MITVLKKALLVGPYSGTSQKHACLESLEELKALAETYGIDNCGFEACPIKKVEAATYIGEGKVEEIHQRMDAEGYDCMIFDEEISPNQQRNIEAILKKPVIDRTGLIIEVFAQRAHTKEARLQVESAKIRYELPRLKRLWTHLSRQRTGGGGGSGGGGYLKGEGEKQIEIDRRILDRRLVMVEHEIKEVRAHRALQRQQRLRTHVPAFAIVGYTNAGKSSLLNSLTDAGVLSEDKLFATLDTTTRRFQLPNHQNVLLIDTVGFIRKLPHKLVDAFRSTLEESVYTDILLHVVDASHPEALEHAAESIRVLEEIGAKDKPIITVINKADKIEDKKNLEELRYRYPDTVVISTVTRQGYDELFRLMIEKIQSLRKVMELRIPQSHYHVASELMQEGRVLETEYEGNDILLTIEIPQSLEYKALPYRKG
ncbi:MAG: GTPase HflX [Verrucomicrobia bacterium]|jgi:GTP-binding protein HflX|nr:GTPase HflX [Verrucomicrobiota bacterium]